MASISDVAKLAGVSITTVSRVINNSDHPVNLETRNRVLKAAEELNFVPSALARALVSDNTRIIGVMVGDTSDPYFATILRGISVVAREFGYLTMICNTDRVPEIELSYVHLLRNYHVDGIIFTGGGLNGEAYIREMKELLGTLHKRNTPVVFLGHNLLGALEINIDNTQAASDMTDYLIRLGHSRIGFISGPGGLTTSKLRLEGYQQSLRKNGIPYDPVLIFPSNFTYEDGQRVTDQIVSLEPCPTAIFASNDLTAIGCLTRLRELNVRVPDEISVAGFDDISAARYVNPPLTTVEVPMAEMGAAGMRYLLHLISSDNQGGNKIVLPHKLIERESVIPYQNRSTAALPSKPSVNYS